MAKLNESAFSIKLVKALERHKFRVLRIESGGTLGGIPDIRVTHPKSPLDFWIETKVDKRQVTLQQKAFSLFHTCGGRWVAVRYINETKEIELCKYTLNPGTRKFIKIVLLKTSDLNQVGQWVLSQLNVK